MTEFKTAHFDLTKKRGARLKNNNGKICQMTEFKTAYYVLTEIVKVRQSR